jgi:hypothetical protein
MLVRHRGEVQAMIVRRSVKASTSAFLVLILTLSASCTLPITQEAPPRTLAVRTADAPRYAPTRPEAVAIVVGRAQAGSCETLGVVAIRAFHGDDPLALLRTTAASLGADVVSDVAMQPTTNSISLAGVALRGCETGVERP